jgi:hypothetical protein
MLGLLGEVAVREGRERAGPPHGLNYEEIL